MHQKVVRYRQEQELTQAQLAERVGCTERHIRDIEDGDYNASVLLLRRLAVALGCRPQDLIGDHNETL